MNLEISRPESNPGSAQGNSSLNLYVVYNKFEETRSALRTAARLARGLDARRVLVVAKVVPFPLPLDEPPVASAFTDAALTDLIAEQDSEVMVRVYLCRDREATIRSVLQPGSLVIIGTEGSRFRRRTPPLARLLKRDGHEVILSREQREPVAL